MANATATKRAERRGPTPKQGNPKPPGPKHNIEAVRQEYYDRIAKHSMTPLWTVMKNVVTKEPVTRCAPVIWHFDDIKRLVVESGGLITAEEAERRVVLLLKTGVPGGARPPPPPRAGGPRSSPRPA